MNTSSVKISNQEFLEYKYKKNARYIVTKAIRSGSLKRSDNCHLCKKETRTNAHHIDYGRPLDVIWLCTKCHGNCHKKDHELNPKNNKQSLVPNIWEEHDSVTIAVSVPAPIFLILKKESIKTKKTISSILRKHINDHYKLESDQLEFNFEENFDDNAQYESIENISSLDKNESLLQQTKYPMFSLVRSERDYCVQGVGGKFFKIYRRHGKDAEELQLNYSSRQFKRVL